MSARSRLGLSLLALALILALILLLGRFREATRNQLARVVCNLAHFAGFDSKVCRSVIPNSDCKSTGAERQAPAEATDQPRQGEQPPNSGNWELTTERTLPTVALQVLHMKGTPALVLEQQIKGAPISLSQLFAETGLKVIMVQSSDTESNEPVTLGKLQDLMVKHSSGDVSDGSIRITAIVATSRASSELKDPTRPDYGVMFDFGKHDPSSRKGFAVFGSTIAKLAGQNVDPEMLLTTAHELAHCFNIHHNDYEGPFFYSGSTIEGYSPSFSAQWKFSAATLKHFRTDPLREILPVRDAMPFGTVTAEHQARHQRDPESLDSFAVVATARQPAGRKRHYCVESPSIIERNGLSLKLETPTNSFVVGTPISLTVGLHNTGTDIQYVSPYVSPEHQFLSIEVAFEESSEFVPIRSPILLDSPYSSPMPLSPGQSIHEEAKLFFGANGWTFSRPGRYRLRATSPLYDQSGYSIGFVQSPTTEIRITSPTNTEDRLVSDQVIGDQQGILLTLAGGDFPEAYAKLSKAVTDAPSAKQSPALRLILGMVALNKAMATDDTSRITVDIAEAQKLLRGTLSASLPPISVLNAQAELAKQLERLGNFTKADTVRKQTVDKLKFEESVKDRLQILFRRRMPLRGPAQIRVHWSPYRYTRDFPAGTIFYVIENGDTLATIAKSFPHEVSNWQQLWKLNSYIKDPNAIYPGDAILVNREQ